MLGAGCWVLVLSTAAAAAATPVVPAQARCTTICDCIRRLAERPLPLHASPPEPESVAAGLPPAAARETGSRLAAHRSSLARLAPTGTRALGLSATGSLALGTGSMRALLRAPAPPSMIIHDYPTPPQSALLLLLHVA